MKYNVQESVSDSLVNTVILKSYVYTKDNSNHTNYHLY